MQIDSSPFLAPSRTFTSWVTIFIVFLCLFFQCFLYANIIKYEYVLFPPFCYTTDSMLGSVLHAFYFLNICSLKECPSFKLNSAFDYS